MLLVLTSWGSTSLGHSCQRLHNPPILWRPPVHCLPSFPNFFHPHYALSLWLHVWSHHIYCFILLNNIVNINLLSLGNLVLAAYFCVFYAIRHQIYWRFDTNDMDFPSTLIWYHIHRQTYRRHTCTNRLAHIYKYISTPPVRCTQQLHVLHWMTNLLIQKIILNMSKISLLFENYSPMKVIYLLIRFKKKSLCSYVLSVKQWILIEMVKMNKTNTPCT